eukprot:scaffold7015_cov88-Cylindrotheca_fusiformis.AAC.1
MAVARELDSSYGKGAKGPTTKSTKSPTTKSTKGPKMSKKTKSPSYTKGSKLSTKSPTLKSTKSSKKGALLPTLVGLPTLDFNGFSKGDKITEWNGLTVTGLRAGDTNPPAAGVLAGIPDQVNTITFTAPAGETFSLLSASMASNASARPLTIKGFDAGGGEIASQEFILTFAYQTYDLSAFANVSKVTFTFAGPAGPVDPKAAIDTIDFV